MRIAFVLDINESEFVTNDWQSEVRHIARTYFTSEATLTVSDIPEDNASVYYDAGSDEFDPI